MTNRNDRIIEKIKGLLALANDHKDDEESQTAFITAQKLMIKYDISSSEIEGAVNSKEISKGQATVYKMLYWWERQLADIITYNFKVKWYYSNKKFNGSNRKKRAIIFMGYESDVALAKEMYVLAYDVLTFYTNKFVEDYYNDNYYTDRSKSVTTELKTSYMRGFLHGLNKKFEEQVKEMEQEYGLMVLVPAEVKEAYEVMFGNKKSVSYKLPSIEKIEAYRKGFYDGKKVDYTKSTLDE